MEMELKELIERLQKELKTGKEKVIVQGTILIPDNGNKIIVTTEKQM